MRTFVLISSLALMAMAGAAKANPVDLTAYAQGRLH